MCFPPLPHPIIHTAHRHPPPDFQIQQIAPSPSFRRIPHLAQSLRHTIGEILALKTPGTNREEAGVECGLAFGGRQFAFQEAVREFDHDRRSENERFEEREGKVLEGRMRSVEDGVNEGHCRIVEVCEGVGMHG